MVPVSVIVSAIALGAGKGLNSMVEAAIRDAYSGFKGLILRKFGKRDQTVKSIQEVEKDPESVEHKETLKAELTRVGADRDQEVLNKATELLKLLEDRSPGATGGLVGEIDADGGKVLVIGTHHGPITM
jgi:hypothetical protein